MNEEIKDHNKSFYSMENLKETIKCYDGYLDGEEVYYHVGALRFAYDYITNLQKENERLKEELQQEKKDFKEANDYCFKLKDYKSRCEKAIDFVKKESKKCYSNQITDNSTKVIGNFMWHTDKLLNILNGGDEE